MILKKKIEEAFKMFPHLKNNPSSTNSLYKLFKYILLYYNSKINKSRC